MLKWIDERRAAWLISRSRHHAALTDMPERVRKYWQLNAGAEFEGIPTGAFFYARASEGLMTFFACIEQAEGKACALPSKAADSVWHAWLKADPIGLDKFTLKHFGQRIPHVEARSMATEMGEALARSLVLSRGLDRKPPEGPGIPGLFALDGKLRMPQGYGYRMRDGEIGYSILDYHGRAGASMHFPPALAAAGLLSAGLITQEMYEAALIRRDNEGSSCGSSSSSSSGGDSDSDGGDGGSSCGGGGCGGGD
jgi:uncharacterized membrane protein YgcG